MKNILLFMFLTLTSLCLQASPAQSNDNNDSRGDQINGVGSISSVDNSGITSQGGEGNADSESYSLADSSNESNIKIGTSSDMTTSNSLSNGSSSTSTNGMNVYNEGDRLYLGGSLSDNTPMYNSSMGSINCAQDSLTFKAGQVGDSGSRADHTFGSVNYTYLFGKSNCLTAQKTQLRLINARASAAELDLRTKRLINRQTELGFQIFVLDFCENHHKRVAVSSQADIHNLCGDYSYLHDGKSPAKDHVRVSPHREALHTH